MLKTFNQIFKISSKEHILYIMREKQKKQEKKPEEERTAIKNDAIHRTKGGMYEILKIATVLLATSKEINCHDVAKHMNLGIDSISQNLNRLVHAGILERTEEKIKQGPKTGGRKVTYKINIKGETIDFLINSLYD